MEPSNPAPRLDDLRAIESRIWDELARSVQPRTRADEPRHGWRRCALATLGPLGPMVRSVVLRDLERDRRVLVVYTDARSPKVAQLRADPRGELLCWCDRLGWQLRLRCRIEVQTDGLDVTARWARVRHSPAVHDYLSPLPPGHPLAGPGDGLDGAAPPPPERVREAFALMLMQVEAVDWLELHPLGQRRAAFDAEGARWLVP